MFLSANCGGGEASLELLSSPCLSKIKSMVSVKLSALNALTKVQRFAVHHAPQKADQLRTDRLKLKRHSSIHLLPAQFFNHQKVTRFVFAIFVCALR